jgi:hypothetical protein
MKDIQLGDLKITGRKYWQFLKRKFMLKIFPSTLVISYYCLSFARDKKMDFLNVSWLRWSLFRVETMDVQLYLKAHIFFFNFLDALPDWQKQNQLYCSSI